MNHTPTPYEVMTNGQGKTYLCSSFSPDAVTEARFTILAEFIDLAGATGYRDGIEHQYAQGEDKATADFVAAACNALGRQTPETAAKTAAFKLAGVDTLANSIITTLKGWIEDTAHEYYPRSASEFVNYQTEIAEDYKRMVAKVRDIQEIARPGK